MSEKSLESIGAGDVGSLSEILPAETIQVGDNPPVAAQTIERAKPLTSREPTNAEVLARGERLERLRAALEFFKSVDLAEVRKLIEKAMELIQIFKDVFPSAGPSGGVVALSASEVQEFQAAGIDMETLYRIGELVLTLLTLIKNLRAGG